MSGDLKSHIKSKDDIYYILSIEGQYHLPTFDECSLDFIREVIAGRKELIKLRDICPVNVPRFHEFNADKLYNHAIAAKKLRKFLPDPVVPNQRPVARKFLFNVSYKSGPRPAADLQSLLGHQHYRAYLLRD